MLPAGRNPQSPNLPAMNSVMVDPSSSSAAQNSNYHSQLPHPSERTHLEATRLAGPSAIHAQNIYQVNFQSDVGASDRSLRQIASVML
jgi:hypothetical protein